MVPHHGLKKGTKATIVLLCKLSVRYDVNDLLLKIYYQWRDSTDKFDCQDC